jgi:hypothetical protein
VEQRWESALINPVIPGSARDDNVEKEGAKASLRTSAQKDITSARKFDDEGPF